MIKTSHYLFVIFAAALALFSIKSCTEEFYECDTKNGVLVKTATGGFVCLAR